MQETVKVKRYAPSAKKGQRLTATHFGKRVLSMPWDYSKGLEENHRAIARAAFKKLYIKALTLDIVGGWATKNESVWLYKWSNEIKE